MLNFISIIYETPISFLPSSRHFSPRFLDYETDGDRSTNKSGGIQANENIFSPWEFLWMLSPCWEDSCWTDKYDVFHTCLS